MLKLLKLFAWIVFTLVILVAVDQFLVRVPIAAPGVTQAQTFYVDFRSRLLGLVGFEPGTSLAGKSIEQVIEASTKAPLQKNQTGQRYLYVDESGVLQFADSFEQVPSKYRQNAQPLAE